MHRYLAAALMVGALGVAAWASTGERAVSAPAPAAAMVRVIEAPAGEHTKFSLPSRA